jgi:hypothetical protein
MEKIVRENIVDEEWVTSDTGIDKYIDDPYQQPKENPVNVKDIIPPKDMKFTPEEFNFYVDGLLEILPKSPIDALAIFQEVLKEHPYLTKRPIGFKPSNPYEPIIQKFIQTFKTVTHR